MASTTPIDERTAIDYFSFVDYFTLAKIDGVWKIVNKVFAHTGGEMPTT
jgi:Putative lumazine-binding